MLEKNQNNIDELIKNKEYLTAGTFILFNELSKQINVESLNTHYLMEVCKNQFANSIDGFSDEKIEKCLLDVSSSFFIKLVTLTKLMIQLNIIDYESIEGGLSITDNRSMIAVTILETYNSINALKSKNNPNETLIPDLFSKTINQCLGIIKMLNLGLLSDAFGSWRTLHESICIIKILIDGGKKVQEEYINHMLYTKAYRGGIINEDENDSIFSKLKDSMKDHNLKSKDMKKFIEYGWIYAYSKYDEKDPTYRLNFRDGIQRCAGLVEYNEWYEIASELSHSSAIFFYSKDEYFLNFITHGLFQMLIILDEIFDSYYRKEILDMPTNYVVNYSLFRNALKETAEKQKAIFNKEYLGADNEQ